MPAHFVSRELFRGAKEVEALVLPVGLKVLDVFFLPYFANRWKMVCRSWPPRPRSRRTSLTNLQVDAPCAALRRWLEYCATDPFARCCWQLSLAR